MAGTRENDRLRLPEMIHTKISKPFFLWHNSSRQHVFIHLKQAAQGQSRAGREDIYGDGLKEHDAHVGQLLDKLAQTGLDKNTIVIYTSDNGAYQYMWPEGGTSPFRGDKGTTWEAGVRVPFIMVSPSTPSLRRGHDFGRRPRRSRSSTICTMADTSLDPSGHEFSVPRPIPPAAARCPAASRTTGHR